MKMNELVGLFLADFRKKSGFTLDDIATASRKFGSGWSTGTLSAMERGGSKADSLKNLLVLVAAINDLTHEGYRLSVVFDSLENAKVDFGDGVSVDAYDIANILDGEEVSADTLGVGEEEQKQLGELREEAWNAARGAAADSDEARKPTIDALVASQGHTPTLSENRAARKLDIPPMYMSAWCLQLFGRYLDDEAASRAGEHANAQKRGAATRVILNEIKAAMNDKAEWLAEAMLNGDM